MRHRPRVLLVTFGTAAALVACSAPSPREDEPTSNGSSAASASATATEPPSAELVPADAGPAVLPGPDPATLAAQTSTALFASASAVVLVDAADTASWPAAADEAGRLGLPLLLTAGDATAAGLVPREAARLGATSALAVGTAAGTAAAGLDDLEVVTDAAELPDLAPVQPVPGTLVLSTGAPGDAPALATAAAAGATVVSAPTGDPRASAEQVQAVAAAAPTRVVGLGAAFGTPEQLQARVATATTGVELPGGGQLVLAGKRYVALYGHPGTAALGVLGEQPLGEALDRAASHAADYQPLSDVTVVPTFEIIATVATAGAGADGNYSNEVDPDFLRPWVEEAGRRGTYVLLDLQPGTTDFLTQAKRYESLLAQPHVGLALDPEWRLAPGQRHLEQIGSVSAAEVNEVSAWMAQLVRDRALPQKMLVLHQFRLSMITDRATLDTSHDELAVVIHADGQGSQPAKTGTWNALRAGAPAGVAFAWKNFYDEDAPMLTPDADDGHRAGAGARSATSDVTARIRPVLANPRHSSTRVRDFTGGRPVRGYPSMRYRTTVAPTAPSPSL